MGTEPARSHYTILGVAPRATSKEIRVAYLNLARALHPDRVGSGSAAEQQLAGRRMREVNEAYEVLGDATRRQAYDRDRGTTPTGQRGPRPPTGPTVGATPAPPRPRPAGSNPERFDADPRWRDDEGRYAIDPDDDVELTPFVAFVLHRGPLIAVLLLAAFLFIATAYAGGGPDEDPVPVVPTTIACSDTPVTGVSGGSVVLEPC